MQNNLDKWLKDNGLNGKYFASVDLVLVQAQQIAHNLIKHNVDSLTDDEVKTIKSYLNKVKNKGTRVNLNPNSAYKVMNIGKRINRKLFKAYRTLNSR
jgi:hypothetical protein